MAADNGLSLNGKGGEVVLGAGAYGSIYDVTTNKREINTTQQNTFHKKKSQIPQILDSQLSVQEEIMINMDSIRSYNESDIVKSDYGMCYERCHSLQPSS